MQKIYLKGFERPYAVFGVPLFEDERHLVLVADGRRVKIPLGNILYSEELDFDIDVARVGTQENNEPAAAVPPQPIAVEQPRPSDEFLAQKLEEAKEKLGYKTPIQQSNTETEATINFVGYKNKSFTIKVPEAVLRSGKIPELSKRIYADPQIKAFLGEFQMQGLPTINGSVVTITTVPLTTKPGMEEAKEKLEATRKLLTSLAPKMPSLSPETTFSMPGSPFSTPMSLQDFDENQ